MVCVCLPEFGAPPLDRFIAGYDTAFEYEFLDFAEAEREPEVQPRAVIDEFGRVAVAFVDSIGCSPRRFSQFAAFNNVTVPQRDGDFRLSILGAQYSPLDLFGTESSLDN